MKARNLYINLLVVLMMLASSACVLVSSMTASPTAAPSPTATMIPTELPTRTHTPMPTATPIPTSTPTSPPPTSTPTLTPIEGIDVPIVIKNVSLQNSLGFMTSVDIEMKILEALRRESLKSGDKSILPKEGNIFLSLSLFLGGSADAIRWVVPNVTLNCGNNSYQARDTVTIQISEGRLQSWQVHYEVPDKANFGECSAQLPDGRAIPLGKLFSGTTGGAPPEAPAKTQAPTLAKRQVILIANPDCPAPKITSADEIIVRVRWGATTTQIAESNADQFTFVFLLDGQDKGDIRPYRQPSESYASLKKYGCGSDESLAWVHWDIPIGRLPLGKHTISINYILDQAISDGMDEYPAGEFGFLEIPFEVSP